VQDHFRQKINFSGWNTKSHWKNSYTSPNLMGLADLKTPVSDNINNIA